MDLDTGALHRSSRQQVFKAFAKRFHHTDRSGSRVLRGRVAARSHLSNSEMSAMTFLASITSMRLRRPSFDSVTVRIKID